MVQAASLFIQEEDLYRCVLRTVTEAPGHMPRTPEPHDTDEGLLRSAIARCPRAWRGNLFPAPMPLFTLATRQRSRVHCQCTKQTSHHTNASPDPHDDRTPPAIKACFLCRPFSCAVHGTRRHTMHNRCQGPAHTHTPRTRAASPSTSTSHLRLKSRLAVRLVSSASKTVVRWWCRPACMGGGGPGVIAPPTASPTGGARVREEGSARPGLHAHTHTERA